ncbi:MAG TPA: adenosylcobinamide-phosphate synthase CbiB [Trichocoleus sp.]
MWFEQAFEQATVLALAAGLDFALGDPWGWPHPVQAMGLIIQFYSRWALKLIASPRLQRLAGVLLAISLIVGSGLVSWGLIWAAKALHPILGWGLEGVLLASCFAGRSLRRAAQDVLVPLQAGDLAQARSRLSLYVGRDTADLSEAEVLRAVFETVTENATDGVLAPLFYALVGSVLPVVGCVPLALAYKAASTLDSMVGYREAPYTNLGWFSARLEDGLTWVPCRLVVGTIAVLSKQPRHVWRVCQRDAIADPSPNAGWSECAYAAALGVQVGGPNRYQGIIKIKPILGDALHPITPDRIQQAMQLTRWAFLIWLCFAIIGLVGMGLLH